MAGSLLKGWRLLDVAIGAVLSMVVIAVACSGGSDLVGKKFRQPHWNMGQLVQNTEVEILSADSGGATVQVRSTGSGASANLHAGGGSSGTATPGSPTTLWIAAGNTTGSIDIAGLYPDTKTLRLYQDFH